MINADAAASTSAPVGASAPPVVLQPLFGASGAFEEAGAVGAVAALAPGTVAVTTVDAELSGAFAAGFASTGFDSAVG